MLTAKHLRQFGMELIQAPTEIMSLGDLVRKSNFGRIDLVDQNIAFAFARHSIIDASTTSNLHDLLKSVPAVKGDIGDQTIRIEINHEDDLQIPGAVSLKGKLDLEKLTKYEFSDIRVKVLTGELRFKLDMLLDELKEKDFKAYKKEVRHKFVIDKLFYGNVNLTVEKKFAAGVEAAFASRNIGIMAKHELGDSVSFKFDNSEVPFAMELAKLRFFE